MKRIACWRITFWCGAALLLSATGCGTTKTSGPPDPVADFRRKHPAEAGSYTQFYAVDLKNYRALAQLRSDKVGDIVAVMKQKYPDLPGFEEYADNIQKTDNTMWANVDRYLVDLSKAWPEGCALYEFDWSDGKKSESGLLLLKSGEVIKRQVWNEHDSAASGDSK